MNHLKFRRDSGGFTIIELLIATVIFSLLMTVILVSAFQIGRIYYKGISVSSTNEAARTSIDDISNDVRFGSNIKATKPYSSQPDTWYFCVGLHRYTYQLFHKVTNQDIDTNAVTGLRETAVDGCPPPDPGHPGANGDQLLGPDMQLNALDFLCANGSCLIHLHIIFYGADNTVFSSSAHPIDDPIAHVAALRDADAACSSSLLSSQFCAMSDLQTRVLQNP